MIEFIRRLDGAQQKQLIRLLDTRTETDELSEPEILPTLIDVLRRALEVPPKDDLPEYLRRRMVDVVRRQFDLVSRSEADELTDFELAERLVDFVLESAERLAGDADRREHFEVFLRTKDRADRVRWLVGSKRFGSLTTSRAFDCVAAHRRAEQIQREQDAHTETAKAMLSDIAEVTASSQFGKAPASFGGRARLASLVSGAAAGAAAASPLGAVAGGLFMAGLKKRELVRVAGDEADKTRKQRARRSKQVQAVVSLSAVVVANASQAGSG